MQVCTITVGSTWPVGSDPEGQGHFILKIQESVIGFELKDRLLPSK